MPTVANRRRPRRRAAVALLLATLLPVVGGCRGLRMRQQAADALAQCRDYACRGATALEVGEWQQAETLLRKAVDASPTDTLTRRHLAETLWQQQQRAEAIAHLRVAINRDPEDAPSMVRLGEMLLAERDLVEAMRLGEEAVRLDDRDPRAWALRGRAHHELGDPERGLADLHQALRIAPEEREVLANVARIYASRNMPRRQLTALHRLADTYPPGETPAMLLADEGSAYLALGRPRVAAERLRTAAASADDDPRILYRLAEAEEAAGRRGEALAAAQRALVADATHAPSQQLLARLTNSNVAGASPPPTLR